MRIALLLLLLTFAIPCRSESIEHGFSPGGAEALVVRTIESASKEILVAAYSFTDARIARSLVDASRRGVRVRVVLDSSQLSGKYSSATFLANAGLPVRIDGKHAIMHNKYMVIDGVTVQTGSFNYTSAAIRKNAENVLVVRDNPQLAKEYATDWITHWNHSTDYQARY